MDKNECEEYVAQLNSFFLLANFCFEPFSYANSSDDYENFVKIYLGMEPTEKLRQLHQELVWIKYVMKKAQHAFYCLENDE